MTGGSAAAAAWESSATVSAASSVSPASSPGGSAHDGRLMSIGEVLSQLRADFPDVTISKLRFLETEGLVEPSRTAAGYRKYTFRDVARLRYVLTAQRDHYLPLRVIRDHLATLEDGAVPTLSAVRSDPDPVADGDVRLTRDELLRHTGLDDAGLRGLEQAGLVTVRSGGGYDADALEAATAAAQLAEYGLEPRHLRSYRAAADREVGLFSQLVSPMTRQQGPAGRAKAADTVRELAALTQRLQAAMVRAGLRETLGR